jgi:hypothetical protein
MLAAQVKYACKYDQLRDHIRLRLDVGSRPLRGASGLVADRGCSRWPCFRAVLDRRSTPPFACAGWSCSPPLHCVRFGRWLGSSLHCIRVLCFWWGGSKQDVRVSRGRFRDLSLEHGCALLLCYVIYRGLLYVVCWYVGVLPLKVGSCGRDRPPRTSSSRFGATR